MSNKMASFRRGARGGLLSLVCAAGLTVSLPSVADTQSMNDELVRMIAEMDTLLPMIAVAESEQDINAPVQFHFESWRDAKGVLHNGLKQDVLAMRAGLVAQINQPVLAPRTINPLANDYLSDTKEGISIAPNNSSNEETAP